MIGEWHAHLDNTKEQMEREIMAAVLSGDMSNLSTDLFDPEQYGEQMQRISELAEEYLNIDTEAENAGAEAGRILAQAKVEAQAAYNASEGARQQAESERLLVNDVTSILVADKTYWNAGYLMGQEMSKGRAAGRTSPYPVISQSAKKRMSTRSRSSWRRRSARRR